MVIKRLFALFLTLALALSLVPSAFAATPAAGTDPWSIEDALADPKTVYYNILGEDGSPVTETRAVTVYEDAYLNSDSSFTVRIYVPEKANESSPIAYIVDNAGWRNNSHLLSGGVANLWEATDPSTPVGLYSPEHMDLESANHMLSDDNYGNGKYAGQALEAGYVVVTAELRSRSDDNHSPVSVGDAKAVIRYLRYNAGKDLLPAGDVNHIILSGMSGGGGLTAAVGASGNSTDFLPYLYALGAAGVEYTGEGEGPSLEKADYMNYDSSNFSDSLADNVFAVVVYAPITDIPHADMAYSWTYLKARMALKEKTTDDTLRYFNEAAITSSQELGAEFVEYVNNLGLSYDGKPVDATFDPESGDIGGVLADVMTDLLKKSIQHRSDNPDAPYYLGLSMTETLENKTYPAGRETDNEYSISEEARNDDSWKTAWILIDPNADTADVNSFDLDSYLYFVAAYTALKTPPAFDGKNGQTSVGNPFGAGESNLFGLNNQTYAHILEYTFKYDSELYGLYGSDPDSAWENYKACGDFDKVQLQGRMLNSIPYLLDSEGEDQGVSAAHWYVRMGMVDRDTSFATATLLYLSLLNAEDVTDVDMRFTWDRIHNYQCYHDAPDSFNWVQEMVASDK